MKNMIALIFLLGFSVHADSLVRLSSDKVDTLTKVCVTSATQNHTKLHDLKKGCACLVGKISDLAAHEQSVGDADMDLDWAIRFYNHTMEQNEVQADRLGIVDRLVVFGEECIRNN